MQKKYLIIYNDLVRKIQESGWAIGNLLPSENELAREYEASRETIRKALDLLSQNGYIQKIQGKGSVVIDRNKLSFPVSGIQSYSELAEKLNLNSRTIVHTLKRLKPEDQREAAKFLKTDPTESIWNVIRTREIDGEKVILDKDYFNETYVPMLSEEICETSIYNHIEKELNLMIGFAKKEIVVETPTKEDHELLDLEGFTNVVVIRSQVHLEDTNLFQFTESRHRPDKFRFVDFARRVKD
ncbi:trehalose operon repressor [Oceanobacillus alkalisoli]|uniref:trehalose operon repressor n=1 Tax=Oceanobacillus alkalisoli TaxID=2925113 RepID=UPI001EE4BB1F|nr:trehalose operon repressor [Oceanobacillus alkalisoli]MCG5102525.1 trehalose operon repressor [Oceanobacillus alkalisoli]